MSDKPAAGPNRNVLSEAFARALEPGGETAPPAPPRKTAPERVDLQTPNHELPEPRPDYAPPPAWRPAVPPADTSVRMAPLSAKEAFLKAREAGLEEPSKSRDTDMKYR